MAGIKYYTYTRDTSKDILDETPIPSEDPVAETPTKTTFYSWYCDYAGGRTCFTASSTPAIGDPVWNNVWSDALGTVTEVASDYSYIVTNWTIISGRQAVKSEEVEKDNLLVGDTIYEWTATNPALLPEGIPEKIYTPMLEPNISGQEKYTYNVYGEVLPIFLNNYYGSGNPTITATPIPNELITWGRTEGDTTSTTVQSKSPEPTTISGAIAAAQEKIAAAYTAISQKGGTLPVTQNLSNLSTAIAEIPADEPVLDSVTIAPSTTAQTLTPPSGVDGFDEVVVSAVTASIDNNITQGNIKSGVEILGVTGTYAGEGVELQNKTLTMTSTTPTLSTVVPDTGYDGLSSVTVDLTYVEAQLDQVLGSTVVPTGTLSITTNGVYDVSTYASADVSVSGGGGGSVSAPIFEANYFVSTDGTISNLMKFQHNAGASVTYYLKPFANSFTNNSTVHNWLNSNLDEVNDNFTAITSVAEMGYSGTTEFISFRALEEAMITSAKSFQLLTSLKKVDLHNAKKVSLVGAFSGLSNFQEIDLTSVEDLTAARALGGTAATGGAFADTSVSTLSFPSLKSTSFGSGTNQFVYMLKGVTGCTVHFPSNLQSVIGSWSDVVSGFDGTNTTILFDLPATT